MEDGTDSSLTILDINISVNIITQIHSVYLPIFPKPQVQMLCTTETSYLRMDTAELLDADKENFNVILPNNEQISCLK